jgi:hypothetical protein
LNPGGGGIELPAGAGAGPLLLLLLFGLCRRFLPFLGTSLTFCFSMILFLMQLDVIFKVIYNDFSTFIKLIKLE